MEEKTKVRVFLKGVESSPSFEAKLLEIAKRKLEPFKEGAIELITLERVEVREEARGSYFWVVRLSINSRYYTLYGEPSTLEEFNRISNPESYNKNYRELLEAKAIEIIEKELRKEHLNQLKKGLKE